MEAATRPELPGPPSPAARYAVAVALPLLVAVLTLGIRSLAIPGLGPAFSVAVAVAAVYGGWGPGAVASVLSLASYFLFPDLLQGALGMSRLVQLGLISAVITWAGGAAYRHRWRAVHESLQSVRLRRVAEEAMQEARQQ